MAEDFDFTLLGDLVVKPDTQESADPVEVLTNKGTVLFFGAHWSERKLNIYRDEVDFIETRLSPTLLHHHIPHKLDF